MAENGTLTPAQRRAIAALLTERDVRSAAAAAKIAERTLWRWLDAPIFREALKAAEGDAVNAASRQLAGLAGTALDAVRTILENQETSASLRLRAAQIVLDNLLKLRELATLEERVSELERNAHESKNSN